MSVRGASETETGPAGVWQRAPRWARTATARTSALLVRMAPVLNGGRQPRPAARWRQVLGAVIAAAVSLYCLVFVVLCSNPAVKALYAFAILVVLQPLLAMHRGRLTDAAHRASLPLILGGGTGLTIWAFVDTHELRVPLGVGALTTFAFYIWTRDRLGALAAAMSLVFLVFLVSYYAATVKAG